MNPFILLLGLVGASALSGLGGLKKESGLKNPKSVNTDEDTIVDPVDEPADEPVNEPAETTGDTTTTNDPAPTSPTQPSEPSEPTDPIVISDETPSPPVQTGGTGENGGETAPLLANGTVDVIAGRVATLEPSGDDVVGLRIVSGVEHGNITVNPDGTMALVLTQSDFTGTQGFTYEATHADGSTSSHDVTLNVTPGLQELGWGTGENHYMLATDENDKVVVEHGEVHTKVYISGSADAYSLADIATLEGMSVSEVTGDWLLANGYGQSEDMALAQDAGMALWTTVTPSRSETSNWLLLERGYEYGDLERNILPKYAGGESEMNPLYIGAWGEGDAPEVTSELFAAQYENSNVVFQDLHISGGIIMSYVENVIFDNILFTDNQTAIMSSSGITVRNSEIIDVVREESRDGGDWDSHSDRVQGLYMNFVDGALVEGNFIDHNAWADDYHADLSGEGGMPPSMWSHNLYMGSSMTDVTLRDTITMRAASFGAQVRSGGFIEDNVFLDNNAALSVLGGDYKDAGPVGQYTLMTDNLVTSGAHKEAELIGTTALGVLNRGELTSLVDNIITHMADPNSDELEWKTDNRQSLANEKDPYYDDTIVYNWHGSNTLWNPDAITTEKNTEGLDTSVLDQTTIQLFAADLLGDPNATIADLANYLRAQADGVFDDIVDADLIIRFFQEGFGIDSDIRGDATTLTFVPNDLGEGVRWDNRMNWDTDDLPGTQDGDSVDLNGNHVVFGTNAAIDTLDFGPGGALNVYGGKLTATGGLTGEGDLNIEGAGQIWTEGADAADLGITVTGGRFANTGEMSGADLTATGGQAILATDGAEYDVDADHRLEIAGSAKAGFDGTAGGTAILDLHEGSTLAFTSDAEGLGEIAEFRSGAFGDAPDVQSGIDLGGATLEIDLAGLSADAGSAFTLMSADEIAGVFEAANVGGLGARDATIVVDYEADSVTLKLSAGSGAVSVETVGVEGDVTAGNETLWDALTADHGVVDETALAQIPEDEEDALIAAA